MESGLAKIFRINQRAALLNLAEIALARPNPWELPTFEVCGPSRFRRTNAYRWTEERPKRGGDGEA